MQRLIFSPLFDAPSCSGIRFFELHRRHPLSTILDEILDRRGHERLGSVTVHAVEKRMFMCDSEKRFGGSLEISVVVDLFAHNS